MIDAMILAPCVKVLAALLVVRLAWWVLGDFILDHVGIPFLDVGWSRDVRTSTVGEIARRAA